MEELSKKVKIFEGIEYVPWEDVQKLLEATSKDVLESMQTDFTSAMAELQQALKNLNNPQD